jgi:predicted RNA-binding Zn-ribbon protein involved in translation (DUF1610 family)
MVIIDLLIQHQCPQCGAPATLLETDRLFSCEFCRVKSYLLQHNFFRYMLPEAAPEDKDLLYFPYWRFKGMLFSCLEDGIKSRFLDASHQAVNSRYFPVSVGLRSQALKLRFVTPETPGRFLKPSQSFKDVMQFFERRVSASLTGPVFHQSHIGENISMIYSPFYVEDKVFDAVLNQPVSALLPDDFDAEGLAGGRPGWKTRFIPAMCPSCGWDLDGNREALVLKCSNCDSAWRPTRNKFKPLKFGHIPANGDNLMYLPFWRIKAEISGMSLQSYADLVKAANLPKAVQENFSEMEFYFWALAFKVRPEVFMRLARNMTLSQPQQKLVGKFPDARAYPVTLPIEEALESLTINLTSFVKPQKEFLPRLRDINISPQRFLLVYVPFKEKHHEYVHPELRLAINKNHLKLAANL